MRYITIAAMTVLLFFATGGPSQAGDFHTGTGLVCSDCHTMHYSQSHGYDPDGGGRFNELSPGGPYDHLLRSDSVSGLCLGCHDGSTFVPDVLGVNSTSGRNKIRQAGALNEVGGSSPYFETTGHTLGSTDTAPGSNPPLDLGSHGLECVSCHAAHGGNRIGVSSYRNLGGFGTIAGSAFAISYNDETPGTPDPTKDVFLKAARSYDISQVWFNEPDPTMSKMADFCKSCHTDFHGAKGSTEMGGATGDHWLRHPQADADIGDLGGGHSSLDDFNDHTNNVKVLGWDGTKPAPATVTPTCISCHKGHGNQNAFGLIFMSGTGTVNEEGDTNGTGVRDLCKQCHVQGG